MSRSWWDIGVFTLLGWSVRDVHRKMAHGADVSNAALCVDDIFEAINLIRYKKRQRPDKKSILKALIKAKNTSEEEFNNLFEEILQAGLVMLKPTTKGKESYYINEYYYDNDLAELLVSSPTDPVSVKDLTIEEVESPAIEEPSQSIDQPPEPPIKSKPDPVDVEMLSLEETYSKFKNRMDIAEKSHLSLLLESYRDTIKHLREEITLKNTLIHSLIQNDEQKRCKQTVSVKTSLTEAKIMHSNATQTEENPPYKSIEEIPQPTESKDSSLELQLIEIRSDNKKKYYEHKQSLPTKSNLSEITNDHISATPQITTDVQMPMSQQKKKNNI